jgi:hypothetical protein
MGKNTYKFVRDLLAPTKPNEKAYSDIVKVVWVWDQSNGKQMILVSMDTYRYKQCIRMK